MKRTGLPKHRRMQAPRIIVAFTLVAVLGGTLAVTPTVSAREFDLFDRFREILGGKPAAQPVQQKQNDQSRLQQLIQKGNQEIDRRQQSLAQLTAKIHAAVTLTAADKAALTAEVTSLSSRLAELRLQIGEVQNVKEAQAIIRSIKAEYNAYAVLMPKIHILKLADDILDTDAKLLNLAGKLQSRINTAEAAGQDVSALQEQLAGVLAQAGEAQAIATDVKKQTLSIALQDNKDNRTVLFNLYQRLKDARGENKAAFAGTRTIVDSLKTP